MARKKDTKKGIKTETSIEKENIEIISLDNKPINEEVIKETFEEKEQEIDTKIKKETSCLTK